jgi:hypothetical protein
MKKREGLDTLVTNKEVEALNLKQSVEVKSTSENLSIVGFEQSIGIIREEIDLLKGIVDVGE